MRYIFRSIVWTFLLCVATATYGQGVFNYSCDFEDATENAQWNLLVGSNAASITNKWYIGSAINNGGAKSLYVSSDGGDSVHYAGSSCVILASRNITLAKTGEDYTLSFDWIANGDKEGSIDGLYVAWVPETDWEGTPITIQSVSNSTLDPDLKAYCLELRPTQVNEDDRLKLNGKSTWQTIKTTITKGKTGKPYRLVFIWRNANLMGDPPACVDNISILDGRACAAPKALGITTAGDDSLILNWEGDMATYEVGCYSYEKKSWQVVRVDTTTYCFTDVPEGFCDFYVRTVCFDTINQVDYFSGKVMSNRFIYYPNNHCIDYITLTDDNCYYTEKGAFNDTRDNITYIKGMIDMGSESKESRHTHHYSKTETDPRTGGKLKTVPEGEIASVRLGNWDTGAQSERAVFNFKVDTSINPILIMKYAVVLENPGHDVGKTSKSDPRFKLEVLRRGNSIGSCSTADFTSSQGGNGWKTYQPSSGTVVVWRDWSTIGVNLAKYHGETLQIRVTSYDCGQSGHYGYAYFTMGCDKADLVGESCDGSSITEFRAPSGFDYKWYLKDNPEQTLSTDQTYYLTDSLDMREYAVDVIFKEGDGCAFTLYASAKPHYPVGEFDYRLTQHDCRNYLQLINKSRKEVVDRKTNDTIRSMCDSIRWSISDPKIAHLVNLTKYQPDEILLPDSMAHDLDVTIRAMVNNCDSIMTRRIHIPAIGTTIDSSFVQSCEGYPYTFRATNYDGSEYVGRTYTATGCYADTLISSIGCDSVIITNLLMRDTLFTLIDTVILSSQSVYFNDTLRNTTGTYVHATRSIMGCDSISTLKLYVHEFLDVAMAQHDSVCADAGIWEPTYTLQQGRLYRYSMQWEAGLPILNIDSATVPTGRLSIPIPQTIQPNRYAGKLIFHDSMRVYYPDIIFDDTINVELTVLYPDSVIAQRWGDVLGIRNESYNGGFQFSAVQWYKNGLLLPGATSYNLYEEGGLEQGAAYTACLTRSSDGVMLFTCPVYCVPSSENAIPTILRPQQAIYMLGKGEAVWYDVMGNRLNHSFYNQSDIVAPSAAGMYILHLVPESQADLTTRVVVR